MQSVLLHQPLPRSSQATLSPLLSPLATLSTQVQIEAAYGPLVGFCDYIAFDQHLDSAKAVALAALRPGHSVLDVGAGSGRLIARTKEQVDDGFCVAADAVEGFVSIDIPWLLAQHNLTVAPHGTPSTQVHCLQANLTSLGFSGRIRAIRGAPQHFDCIFALHVFNTLAPEQRRPALTQLRRLLSPNGHLILTMSARFCLEPSLEATTPVQFRTAPHTEAPGAAIHIFGDMNPVDEHIWVMSCSQSRPRRCECQEKTCIWVKKDSVTKRGTRAYRAHRCRYIEIEWDTTILQLRSVPLQTPKAMTQLSSFFKASI